MKKSIADAISLNHHPLRTSPLKGEDSGEESKQTKEKNI